MATMGKILYGRKDFSEKCLYLPVVVLQEKLILILVTAWWRLSSKFPIFAPFFIEYIEFIGTKVRKKGAVSKINYYYAIYLDVYFDSFYNLQPH